MQKLLQKKNRKQNRDFSDLDLSKMPAHVACIMDGNGRWAKLKGLPRAAGHREGMERVKDIVRYSSDIGVKVLTLYAFSTENWKRPKTEVGVLMGLLVEYLRSEIEELHKENVRLLTLGDISRLPETAMKEVAAAKEKTKNNTGMILNIALNYGSRLEITQAVRKLAEEVKADTLKLEDINESAIAEHLYTAGQPDPDLVIRTSGEQRISNFLLFQIAYAEIVFIEENWPDFDCDQYKKALLIYQNRKRRFGGL
ncbi:MAG: isoprenyl transferase [Eubacteriales bacterium]